jgi:dUTP pyrophosphatase
MFEGESTMSNYGERVTQALGQFTPSAEIPVDIVFTPKNPGTPMPAYATQGAAGMDLHADLTGSVTIAPKQTTLIPTGLYVAVPDGYELQIRPRSGLALKYSVTVGNSPGTIDADYRGEVGIILSNGGAEDFVVKPFDRVAQAVLAPVMRAKWVRVTDLPDTARGDGGFGSTGH